MDIILIAVCATVCTCDDWKDIEAWVNARKEWLRKYLELQNGIPSHDNIKRVSQWIDPKEFEKCFISWMKEITEANQGGVVAINSF